MRQLIAENTLDVNFQPVTLQKYDKDLNLIKEAEFTEMDWKGKSYTSLHSS